LLERPSLGVTQLIERSCFTPDACLVGLPNDDYTPRQFGVTPSRKVPDGRGSTADLGIRRAERHNYEHREKLGCRLKGDRS
jgi:hypothetical protein